MSNVASQAVPDSLLPEQFKDLEPFVGAWSLATERERNRERLSSTMAEIQALYDALLPRMDEIIGYLNQFPIDGMPDDGRRLFYLTLSLAEVAPAVEFYKQPEVVDGFPAERFVPV
jgi:hypothetical protein